MPAEVAAHLNRQGPRGSEPNLASMLLGVLGSSSALSIPAGEPEAAAQLLACAASNLARARYGPLPRAAEPAQSPMEPVLTGMQVTGAGAND